jgi:hypothetical protein
MKQGFDFLLRDIAKAAHFQTFEADPPSLTREIFSRVCRMVSPPP